MKQDQQKQRAMNILRRLKKEYPSAGIALNYKTPVQLLVAVMLSAQATDEQVNKTTQALFKKYKTASDFAERRFKRSLKKKLALLIFLETKRAMLFKQLKH